MENTQEPIWYTRKQDPGTLRLAEQLGVKDLFQAFGAVIHKNDLQGVADAMKLELSFVLRNLFEPEQNEGESRWANRYL